MRKMRKRLGDFARRNATFARALLSALLIVLLVSQSVPTEALATGMETIAEGVSTTLSQPEGEGDESAGDESATDEVSDESASDDAAASEETSAESGDKADDASTDASTNADTDANTDAGSAGSDDGDEEPTLTTEPSATYEGENDLVSVTVEGTATESEDAATNALVADTSLSTEDAREVAVTLFSAGDEEMSVATKDGEDLPNKGDGSNVDDIEVKWITEDTDENNDDSLLNVRPTDDSERSVRLRVTYALSGAYDYGPGDISITIPATMFYKRDGSVAGTMRLSIPEDPSTSGTWNYRLIGDEYLITNTRTMSAASQGFLEFAFDELVPHELVDRQESEPFSAKIEVFTNKGNIIGARSNEITAEFDTQAEVISATTYLYSAVERVPASEIPEGQRASGESSYVIVSWYTNAFVPETTNQEYVLSLTFSKTDGYTGFVVGDDGATTSSGSTTMTVTDGYRTGTTPHKLVSIAYPFSQFKSDQTYTFKARAEYTLTECDPELRGDPQKQSSAVANASEEWHYIAPKFVEPTGHYNVFTYGNSNRAYGDGNENLYTDEQGKLWRGSDIRETINSPTGFSQKNGYYGVYPSALNELRKDNSIEVSYTSNTVGYLLPWTFEAVTEGPNQNAILSNYGRRNVQMVTEDRGLSLKDTGTSAVNSEPLTLGEDYSYKSVEFARRPTMYAAEAVNINEDGSVDFDAFNDGTVEYVLDTDVTHIPNVTLQIKRGGTWQDYAVASWTSGSLVITGAGGNNPQVVNTNEVMLPSNTEGVRTVVTTNRAAVLYHTRVNFTVYASGELGNVAESAFNGSRSPERELWNYSNMTATVVETGEQVVSINKRGYDRLQGYTNDIMAMPSKSTENVTYDSDQLSATITYRAQVELRSFITDEATHEDAVAEGGELPRETSGTWYDLLPRGVQPKLDTVQLRDKDTVREVYTIENYEGTGRTLLVVKADLTPVTETTMDSSEEDVVFYSDVLTLTFDAEYDYSAIEDYGETAHNVFAYRSDSESIGTIDDYEGETGPSGSNNVATRNAFAEGGEGEVERNALATLSEGNTTPCFLYGGVTTTVAPTYAGEGGVRKQVMVNNDGRWSDGWDYADPSQARDVYVSGNYSYRLAVRSGEKTTTSDIVLYDVIEAYVPEEGNQPNDINAPRWQGAFVGVDTSVLEAAGCDPKVYYSTQELKLDNGQSGQQMAPNEENMLYRDGSLNTGVWHELTDSTNPSEVRSIAIDASKSSTGGDFVLASNDTVSAYIIMKAPQGSEATGYIEQDAHAYNNVYLSSLNTQEGTSVGEENFIRQDYTKVGLVEYNIDVEKVWDDGDDRDGVRPDSVQVRLLANGEPASTAEVLKDSGWSGSDTLTLSDANEWKGSFEALPYLDDDGNKIIYTFEEVSGAEGYQSSFRFDGNKLILTNVYSPETTEVSGTKTWSGDTTDVRPTSVRVNLYADGEYYASKTVRPDIDGTWSYTFTDLPKNRDHGTAEIVWTVEESVTSAPSYTDEVNGYDIVNTYHPYGDLLLRKDVADVTDASKDTKFSFMLTFTRESEDAAGGASAVPVFDVFEYEVHDSETDALISTGEVSTGETIELQGGQYALVKDVPEYLNYEIEEESVPGFSSSSEGATGTIEPNDTAEATFTNTYSSSVSVNFQARKTLTGRTLTPYQFRFELVDGSDNVIRTASNAAPDVNGELDDGNAYSEAPVTFGAITYTQKDDGQTYTYTIRETNSERPGYEYDTQTLYHVSVTPKDNGDGTMTATVRYEDAEGNEIPDPVAQGDDGVVFDNNYEAHGELALSAHKSIAGGDLTAGQFTFEIGLVSTDQYGNATFKSIQSDATNAEDGTVDFDPIAYDQRDAGKSYLYAIHEVAGDDETIEYDGHWWLVSASITDNGDGTLSVQTELEGLESNCWECHGSDSDCSVCGGDGRVTSQPDGYEFENSYGPGSLDVEKTVSSDSDKGYDPSDTFTFRVELTNEEGLPLDDVTSENNPVSFEDLDGNPVTLSDEGASGLAMSQAASSLVALAEAATSEAAGLRDSGSAQGGEATTAATETTATPRVTPDGGTEDGWTWRIDNTGVLTLGGTNIKLSNSSPWVEDYVSQITEVKFERGSSGCILSSTTLGPFVNATSLKEVDFTNFTLTGLLYSGDLEIPSMLTGLFKGCSALESVTFGSSFDTSSVENMSYMFYGCESLASVDLFDLDTSSVENMSYMFYGCESLASVDLFDLDTSSVQNMSYMFNGCSSLVSVDLSDLDTSSVTNMTHLFSGCELLVSVDLSDLDTSSVTRMQNMFEGCSSLTSLNLSGFNTSSVQYMTAMFEGCSSLESLDISSFNTQNATSMTSMFEGCSSLTSLNLSGFNTSSVQYMTAMFEGCSSLESLDISSFNTQNATSMTSMFVGCTSLSSVTLGEDFRFVGKYCELPDPDTVKGTWVKLNSDRTPYDVSYTPEDLADQYPATGGPGTYVWDTFVTISFDANGGKGSMTPMTNVDASDGVKLTTMSGLYRPGYRFVGWNTQANGKGTSYADGATVPASQLKKDLTLYAQWESVVEISYPEAGVIEITMPANLRAHVPNLPSGTSYRVYEKDDSMPEGWRLVKSSGTAGSIKPGETETALFENCYEPDVLSASVQFNAKKMLDGSWASASDGFKFELFETKSSYTISGSPLQTVAVSDGGGIVFDPISYDETGTHYYVIREVQSGNSSIAYDSTTYRVKVRLMVSGGKLVPTVTYLKASGGSSSTVAAGNLVFNNTTKTGRLSITKTAAGALSEATASQQFTFQVTLGGVPYSGNYTVGPKTRKTSDGRITLAADETATISGQPAGTSYQVQEIEVPAGWQLKGTTGNLSGAITANSTVALTFTNEYATSGWAQLMAYKQLEGGTVEDGQFEFELLDSTGKVIETVKNGPVDTNETIPDPNYTGTGTASEVANPAYGLAPAYFSTLTFDKETTETYTIREKVPDGAQQTESGDWVKDGIVYDGSTWTVTVKMSDNGNGTLTPTVTYAKDSMSADMATFTNKLEPTSLTVRKSVENGQLSEKAQANATFTFTLSLKDATGASLAEPIVGQVYNEDGTKVEGDSGIVTVSDGGPFSLGAGQYVVFDEVPVGTVYEVTEEEKDGWTQVADKTTNTSGTLGADGAEAVVTNAYSARGTATFEATKRYNGSVPEDGQFTFLLVDETEGSESEGMLLQSVTNNEFGQIEFQPIEYTEADDGKTFTYSLYEQNGGEENISYDKSVVEVKVTVADNGDGTLDIKTTYNGEANPYEFQNWLAVTLARTGGPGVWAAGAGTVAVALGCLVHLRRKRGLILRGAKHARR